MAKTRLNAIKIQLRKSAQHSELNEVISLTQLWLCIFSRGKKLNRSGRNFQLLNRDTFDA